jgi:hypothetical protein
MMSTPRHAWALLALVAAAGCNFTTHYDLAAPGGSRRQLIVAGAAPDGWTAPNFDDSAWQSTIAPVEQLTPAGDGTMPSVYVRQRFDLGPAPGRYRTLNLEYRVAGSYRAFINGHELRSDSAGSSSLVMVPGMVQASGNVLAIAIQPSVPAIAIDARLDGDSGTPLPHDIVKGPYLTGTSAGGATIRWQTQGDLASVAVVDGVTFDGGFGQWHAATVTGLTGGQVYPYYVETDGVRSEEAQLATAPAPGQRLRFAVWGDNRTVGNVHRELVAGLVAEAPDFVINTGDMVGNSSPSEWRTFFDIEYPLLISTPIYPAIGNHESDYGEADMFGQLFPLGNGHFHGRVYSFDYGSAHVAVLDSNQELDEQTDWLDEDLAAADARGQRSFIALHWGPVCGCAGFQHGGNDEAEVVLDVATRHRVSAIFSGHNHIYERGLVRGITYVVTGGGGAPLMSTGVIASTQATFSQNHYVMVEMLGDQVRLTAKTAQGLTLDDAVLAPPSAAAPSAAVSASASAL